MKLTEQDAAVLPFPNRKADVDVIDAIGDELVDIEMVLRATAERLRQLSKGLDRQLQHGHLDQLGDPFAVTADVGDRIDHASQATTLAANHALTALNMWRSGWNQKQAD